MTLFQPCVRLLLSIVAAALTAEVIAQPASDRLTVHEWGTFTSLQDEAGKAIGGVNTDDEPVPPFVHRLADSLMLKPTEVPPVFFQGAPHCHPDVTLRLETPVIYFHLPQSRARARNVSVTARFRGGWLSEFFPNAEATAPGVSPPMGFGHLKATTVSSLAWKNLEVGGNWPGPETSEPVWTSPRAVRAADIRTPGGEAERFLFYRGVAHLDAPISVERGADNGTLVLRDRLPSELADQAPRRVTAIWLVDIDPKGRLAFRALSPVDLDGSGKILASTPSHFAPEDYREAHLGKLQASLHQALLTEGLFADEAQALLDTWRLSYFKSAGARLFFLVPRAWTDFYLPLDISTPAETVRVMVGRIELVTPSQRNALRRLAQLSPAVIETEAAQFRKDYFERIVVSSPGHVGQGLESLQQYGISVPESYGLYLSLGRFRNALLLEEAGKRPSPGLSRFISSYRLKGFAPKTVGN